MMKSQLKVKIKRREKPRYKKLIQPLSPANMCTLACSVASENDVMGSNLSVNPSPRLE